MKIGTISRGFLEEYKLFQHAYQGDDRWAEMKLEFWKLKVTADTRNTRNQSIWHA
jgi:hypothetical protein